MSKEREAIELLITLVNSTEYDKGSVKKFGKLAEVAEGLAKLKIYAEWIDFSMLMDCLMVGLRSVNSIYDGIPPIEDQKNIAKKIHKNLIQMPLSYTFYFHLPEGLEMNDTERIVIDENATIEKVSPEKIHKITEKNKYTYLAKPWSLRRMAGLEVLKQEAIPNYTNLIENETYLVVEAKGLIGEFSLTTEDIDPIHIYKLFIAFMALRGHLVSGDLIHALTRRSIVEYGKQAVIYNKGMVFIKSEVRPHDESEYVSGFVFSKKLDSKKLDFLLNDFRSIIKVMRNEYLEAERNKIVNSLYWYFEGEKTKSRSFRSLLQVSMFDAFYTQKDKQEDIIKSILTLGEVVPDDYELYRGLLKEMYKRRNDIAHGKIQLLEIHRSKEQEHLRDSLPVRISYIYKKFIEVKISKLLT